jgi:hypothetical protein
VTKADKKAVDMSTNVRATPSPHGVLSSAVDPQGSTNQAVALQGATSPSVALQGATNTAVAPQGSTKLSPSRGRQASRNKALISHSPDIRIRRRPPVPLLENNKRHFQSTNRFINRRCRPFKSRIQTSGLGSCPLRIRTPPMNHKGLIPPKH